MGGSQENLKLASGTHAEHFGSHTPAAVAIFQALRAWRLEISRSQHVPPYVVASDSALRSIAASRPRDPDALLDCYDMGPKRVQRYGRALLALVALHARD